MHISEVRFLILQSICFSFVKPIMPSGFFHLNPLGWSISSKRGVWLVFILLPCFTKILVCIANSVNPEQMPHAVASDQGLHCFPMSFFYEVQGINELIHSDIYGTVVEIQDTSMPWHNLSCLKNAVGYITHNEVLHHTQL